MSCGYSEERLALWMDASEADLPVAEIREMNLHLASCATCREAMAILRENQLFARTLRGDAVNSAAVNQVHQHVMDRVADLKRPPAWVIHVERSLFFGIRRKYALAGFGSFVLACGLTLGILWGVHRQERTTMPIPPVPVPVVAAVSEPVAVNLPAGDEPHPTAGRVAKQTPKTRTISADSLTPLEHSPQIMVRLFTDDPSVVIYWTLDGKGEVQ